MREREKFLVKKEEEKMYPWVEQQVSDHGQWIDPNSWWEWLVQYDGDHDHGGQGL